MKKILFILLSFSALFFFSTQVGAQNVGEKAPDFSYSDLNGTTHSLSSYKGKVVFLFAFGNGCPYCEAIGNDTETKVQDVYGSRSDFQALGLDTWDNTSNAASVGAFQDYTKISYPLLLKAGSFESKYSSTYDRVLVIDQDGILRHKSNKAVKNDLNSAIAVIESLYMSTGTSDLDGSTSFSLGAVFPNPSTGQANIRFRLVTEEQVEIRLYDVYGRELKRILDETVPAGEHVREFSCGDYPAGVYLVKMNAGGRSFVRKMQISR